MCSEFHFFILICGKLQALGKKGHDIKVIDPVKAMILATN